MAREITTHTAPSVGGVLPADTPEDRLVEVWLHGKGQGTRRVYRETITAFRAWYGRPLATLTLIDLQDYADELDQRTLAPATRARTLATIKSLLTFGHDAGVLPVNVGRAVPLPPVRDRLEERILPEADLLRVIMLEPDDRNRALLRLLYSAGLRISEACTLRWRDMQPHDDAGVITVLGKGAKTRTVRLSTATYTELAGRRGDAADDDPIFRSQRGKPLSTTQAWRIVRAAALRAGTLPGVSPHWFRHAHASHALDRGAPVHLVQQTLGHANVSTTGRYLHARPGESSGNYLAV